MADLTVTIDGDAHGATAALDQVRGGLGQVEAGAQSAQRQMGLFVDEAGRLREANGRFASLTTQISSLTNQLLGAQKGAFDWNSFNVQAGQTLTSVFKTGALGAVGLAAAIGGIGTAMAGSIGRGAVETGAEFEALEARLSTLLGSTTAARDRMEELFSISTSTPFDLKGLVEAETRLEGFGIEMAKMPEWRTATMDLAGAMGLDLVDAADAMGRAFAGGAGAADVLRERGVLNMIELRTGIDTAKMSAEEFRGALLDTLTDPNGKIAGGSAKLAQTFNGLMSNLVDEWTRFTKVIADSGAFDTAKMLLIELLDTINRNRDIIVGFGMAIGETLVGAFLNAYKGAAFFWDIIVTIQATFQQLKAVALDAFATMLENIDHIIKGLSLVIPPLQAIQQILGYAFDFDAIKFADGVASQMREAADEARALADETLNAGGAFEAASQKADQIRTQLKTVGKTLNEVEKSAGDTAKTITKETVQAMADLSGEAMQLVDALKDLNLSGQERELKRLAQQYEQLQKFYDQGLIVPEDYTDALFELVKREGELLAELAEQRQGFAGVSSEATTVLESTGFSIGSTLLDGLMSAFSSFTTTGGGGGGLFTAAGSVIGGAIAAAVSGGTATAMGAQLGGAIAGGLYSFAEQISTKEGRDAMVEGMRDNIRVFTEGMSQMGTFFGKTMIPALIDGFREVLDQPFTGQGVVDFAEGLIKLILFALIEAPFKIITGLVEMFADFIRQLIDRGLRDVFGDILRSIVDWWRNLFADVFGFLTPDLGGAGGGGQGTGAEASAQSASAKAYSSSSERGDKGESSGGWGVVLAPSAIELGFNLASPISTAGQRGLIDFGLNGATLARAPFSGGG